MKSLQLLNFTVKNKNIMQGKQDIKTFINIKQIK